MRVPRTWHICYDDNSITECVRKNKPTRFAEGDKNLLWEPGKRYTIKEVQDSKQGKEHSA